MSLDVRTTYLNWLIGASLGLALWYRNEKEDRPIGAFLLVVSLIFLFEYSLANLSEPETTAKVILIILGLSTFIFSLIQIYTSPSDTKGVEKMNLVLNIAGLMYFIYQAAYGSMKTGVTFCTWGSIENMIIFSILLFINLGICIYRTSDSILLVLTILLGISIPIICWLYNPNCFGYYFVLSILFMFLLYWMLPFYWFDFHEKMNR